MRRGRWREMEWIPREIAATQRDADALPWWVVDLRSTPSTTFESDTSAFVVERVSGTLSHSQLTRALPATFEARNVSLSSRHRPRLIHRLFRISDTRVYLFGSHTLYCPIAVQGGGPPKRRHSAVRWGTVDGLWQRSAATIRIFPNCVVDALETPRGFISRGPWNVVCISLGRGGRVPSED